MDVEEALRRIRLITPMLRQDVGTAVASHSVMEACNDVIPTGMKGIQTAYNDTYGIVQNALALKLAMDRPHLRCWSKPQIPPGDPRQSLCASVGGTLQSTWRTGTARS